MQGQTEREGQKHKGTEKRLRERVKVRERERERERRRERERERKRTEMCLRGRGGKSEALLSEIIKGGNMNRGAEKH